MRVEGLEGPVRIRRLNAETAMRAATSPDEFHGHRQRLDRWRALDLLPFETMRVDAAAGP